MELNSYNSNFFWFIERCSACMLSRFSHVWPLATTWTLALQAPLSMGFCRQEYWSGQPFFSPGDLPNPGIELESSALQADSLLSSFFTEPSELKPEVYSSESEQNKSHTFSERLTLWCFAIDISSRVLWITDELLIQNIQIPSYIIILL